jgi:Hemerythrin HHE cation binding domain
MPSESTDITDQILAHHEWFREQFVRLDDAKAAGPANPDALRAVWDPLATKLDLHAIAEEEIFYPQLLRRGTEDPEEATLDAIGDHNDIRDGVHAAETHTVGTPEWWAAVTAAREANDEHMAEEEREGIADFRTNAPAGLREALGRQFARFFEQHPTTDGVNVSDKNPERYVETIERDIVQTREGDGSLGIGSLKGQRQL